MSGKWFIPRSLILQNRNYDAALAELDKEAKLNPKHPAIPYYRGLVAMKKEQRKEAEAYFNEALKLDPADPFFYRERAFLNAMNGKRKRRWTISRWRLRCPAMLWNSSGDGLNSTIF